MTKMDELAGKAQTVLGTVDPGLLGMTSSHEHIFAEMTCYYEEPAEAWKKSLVHQPLSFENLAWARTDRFLNMDNMKLDNRELAVQEVLQFKHAGGTTIADVSPIGMHRDALGLASVARATGVNIIMGSGYYVGISHPDDMDARTEDQIADEMVNEIVVGVGSTGIKPGLIGELGCSVPLSKNEEKVLRASAKAQMRTGAPIAVHPSFRDDLALAIVDILSESGASLSNTMICHMDTFEFSLETRMQLLDRGCYIGYDNFGNIGYPHAYLGRVINLGCDVQRIRDIRELIDLGYLEQILIGSDNCFKDGLKAFGGHGYAHVVENVAPLMRAMDFTKEEVDALLIDNPRDFYTFGEPLV
jgi:phosphotriesterase-related protein